MLQELLALPNGNAIRGYINSIPPIFWALHAFPSHTRRWGQTTSNIVESTNAALASARELPPLQMLHHIWLYQQRLFAQRHDKAATLGNQVLALASTLYLEKALVRSQTWIVVPASSSVSPILKGSIIGTRNPQGGERPADYITTLYVGSKLSTCSCGEAWEHGRPCQHAIRLAHHFRQAPIAFFHPALTKDAVTKTYSKLYPPINLETLQPDDAVMPPKLRVLRGRIQKKRRQHQPRHQRRPGIPGSQRCSGCGVARLRNHNIRSCQKEQSRLITSGSLLDIDEGDSDRPQEDGASATDGGQDNIDTASTDAISINDEGQSQDSAATDEHLQRVLDSEGESFHTLDRYPVPLQEDVHEAERPSLEWIDQGPIVRVSLQPNLEDISRFAQRFKGTDRCHRCKERLPTAPSNLLSSMLQRSKVSAEKNHGLYQDFGQPECAQHRLEVQIWPAGFAAGYPQVLDLYSLEQRLLKLIDRTMRMPFLVAEFPAFIAIKLYIAQKGGDREWLMAMQREWARLDFLTAGSPG